MSGGLPSGPSNGMSRGLNSRLSNGMSHGMGNRMRHGVIGKLPGTCATAPRHLPAASSNDPRTGRQERAWPLPKAGQLPGLAEPETSGRLWPSRTAGYSRR